MRKLSSKLGVFTALSVLALSGVTASCSSSDDNKELDSIYDTSNYKATPGEIRRGTNNEEDELSDVPAISNQDPINELDVPEEVYNIDELYSD